MPRKPTPDNLAALCQLLTDARSKTTLRRWVSDLPNTKATKPKANDEPFLIGLEIMCRLGERQGIDRHYMLTRFVEGDTNKVFGKGKPGSIARRFAKKLKAKHFTERQLNALMKKLGVPDPSKLRLIFDPWPSLRG